MYRTQEDTWEDTPFLLVFLQYFWFVSLSGGKGFLYLFACTTTSAHKGAQWSRGWHLHWSAAARVRMLAMMTASGSLIPLPYQALGEIWHHCSQQVNTTPLPNCHPCSMCLEGSVP